MSQTIEARAPMAPASHTTPRALLVSSIAEKAKTGYDWLGTWLTPGRLHDFALGDLVVTIGRRGSAKNGEKVGRLYVAAAEALLVPDHVAESDEWAVELRERGRQLLALAPEERVRLVLTDEIGFREDDPPRPTPEHTRWAEAKAAGWRSATGWLWGLNGQYDEPYSGWGAERQPWGAGVIAQRLVGCEERLAAMQRDLEQRQQAHAAYLARLRTVLASLGASPAEESAERAAALTQIRALMAQHGIGVDKLAT